jgi:type VI secretion system protein ImpF
MAKKQSEQPLVSSVLDRLLDDEPQVQSEPPASQHQVMRELKQSVCRDLQDLLNTRVRNLTWPEGLQELNRSLLSYGLGDFAHTNLASAKDRETFCRLLESVIRQHEPRLIRVTVEPVSGAEPLDRTFRFRIDGLLRAEPAPEPVVFDSEVRPATGDFRVGGAGADRRAGKK